MTICSQHQQVSLSPSVWFVKVSNFPICLSQNGTSVVNQIDPVLDDCIRFMFN